MLYIIINFSLWKNKKMFFLKWENIKQTWIMLYIIINFSLWKNKKMFFF